MRVSQWINRRLAETPGELFKDGKWRFWFVAVFGLQLLITLLTYLLFPGDMGVIVLLAGSLLLWLSVGFLHYTDSGDEKLDFGVSLLDCASLVFVALHFCFVLWVFGHTAILRARESNYEQKRVDYNNRIDKDRDRQLQRSTLDAQRAKSELERARLEADAAYWGARSGRTTGAPPQRGVTGASTPEGKLETFEKPIAPEGETADQYLARMDGWIRLAGAGELVLAVITLIFIRLRSVRANHNTSLQLPAFGAGRMTGASAVAPLAVGLQPSTQQTATQPLGGNPDGLQILRDVLADIAFHHPGYWFRAERRVDHVRIRLMTRVRGQEKAVNTAKVNLSILDDAQTMDRGAFRDRLQAALRRKGFPT